MTDDGCQSDDITLAPSHVESETMNESHDWSLGHSDCEMKENQLPSAQESFEMDTH